MVNNMPVAGQLWKHKQDEVYYFVNEVKDDAAYTTVVLDQVGLNSNVKDWQITATWLLVSCEKVR